MRNKLLGFVLVGAAVGALFAACGDETTPGPTSCTSDSSCQTGEICHPTAKVCVQSCTSGSDCPDTAKNCDSLTAGGPKFCQCSTDALCGGGTGSSTICAKEDKICTTKCSTDSACGTGRVCVDGDCKTGSGTDAGTGCNPACAANQTCTNNACVATACSSSNPEPDACADGTVCSGSACALIPAPTCPNATGHGTSWVPGTNAPVIYDISKVSWTTNSTTFCGTTNTTRVKMHVKAYWKQGTFPTSGDSAIEQMLHYIKANGSEGSTTSTIQNTALTNSNHNIEFDQNFCLDPALTTFGMADHFVAGGVDGNVFCASAAP